MDEEPFCMLSMEQSHFSLADGAQERGHSSTGQGLLGKGLREICLDWPSFRPTFNFQMAL